MQLHAMVAIDRMILFISSFPRSYQPWDTMDTLDVLFGIHLFTIHDVSHCRVPENGPCSQAPWT
eukprot:442821-Amphidinium_carterae.1